MLQKIAGWKAKTLSQAGRTTLTKPVASALPQYCMSTFLLPKGWCENIDKLLIDFWWGFPTQQGHHFTPKAWSLICLPKENGGLGIQMTSEVNRALVSKLAWLIETQPTTLWVKLLKAKYCRHCDFMNIGLGANCSWVWRGILST